MSDITQLLSDAVEAGEALVKHLREARETIRFMAENVHQAYHQDISGGWWICPRTVCNAAQQALPTIVKQLKGNTKP